MCKIFVVLQICSEVKLVGGSGPHEGNIFVGGLPVCDDDHDEDNARVVCRFHSTVDTGLEFVTSDTCVKYFGLGQFFSRIDAKN